jgi:precorrin-3B synthase
MTSTPAKRPETSAPVPSARRGECPTLQRPMQTGDGLLARLRPLDNHLTLGEVRALAGAAQAHGNGIVEITARGSLQIRGLKPETVAPFERAVLGSGISVTTGLGVETGPLAGLDQSELVDMRPLAEELRRRVSEHVPPLQLAPKLAVTLDGGGRFHLGHITADIRVTAFERGGRTGFLLAVGGTNRTARPVVALEQEHVLDAVIAVLEHLAATGPAARSKDIDLSSLGTLYDPGIKQPDIAYDPENLTGIHALDPECDRYSLGVVFPYCQADSAALIGFADAAEKLGVDAIRLAPDHGFLVNGLSRAVAEELKTQAESLGFWTAADDPRQAMALCAGSRGCASAFFDTRALAETILAFAPDLCDTSFTLHLSGCPKGCAHPAATLLALTGAPTGYGLVVNGAASAEPATYIAANDIEIALSRLNLLVRQSKEDGESASACLTRLGGSRIAAALQLDRT